MKINFYCRHFFFPSSLLLQSSKMIRILTKIKCKCYWNAEAEFVCSPRTYATTTQIDLLGEQEFSKTWDTAQPYSDIPGPRKLPLFGNLLRFLPGGDLNGLSPLEMQKTLYDRFGPIVRLSGLPGRSDILFLFEPEDVCKVFRSSGAMPIRDTTPSIYFYRTQVRPEWFQGVGGALVAQGDEWYNFRTKVNKLMLAPKSVKRYMDPINEVADDFIEKIHEIRDEKNELPGDFYNELFKWGLETVVAISLDTRLGCLAADAPKDSEAQRIIAASQRIFNTMDDFAMMPFLWRMGRLSPLWRQYVQDFDFLTQTAWKYTRRTLADLEAGRLPAGEDKDREPSVLVRLLQSEPPEVAAVLSADIITGGSETTAKAMATLLTNLARFPQEQSALAQELRRELPGPRPHISQQVLPRLPRLRAFLKESMRFSPSVPSVPRTTIQKLVLSGYQVPQGTEVLACQLLMSRQDKNIPRANEFLLDRWLRGDEGSEDKGHPFASLPFGYGARMCIGMRFAELELQILMAKIVHRYIVEYHYGEMPFKGKPMYGPSAPLKFRLIERDLMK